MIGRTAFVGVAGAALLLAASPATAATTVADWEMNETSGRVLHDSAGTHSGTIGADVRTTGSAYRFPWVKPHSGEHPEHLVTVPHSWALNPGSGVWSVTARFRTTAAFGNMIQKGQGGKGKTYFKMQAPRGVVSCLFRGASGSVSVNSGRALNDGAWHTVTCRRAGNEVTMTIDGTKVRRGSGPTGAIRNTFPLAIGGKPRCGGRVSCDYWAGQMDAVRITRG